MLFTLISTSLLAVASTLAAPARLVGCPVTQATLPLPTNQTVITTPTDAAVFAVGLGVGVQNYTCTNGAFTSIGAVADLFDISCLVNRPGFSANEAEAARRPGALRLGKHYFITNPLTGTGISPKFDFTQDSQKGNANAFTTVKKFGGIPAPTGAKDVDWLELTSIQGDLAKYVFRINTRAGQPPSSCTTAGQVISVPYTAQYWFLK